jgi:FdhE protein
MSTAGTALDSLKRQRPEWAPWLAVVEEIVREAESTHWDPAVPPMTEMSETSQQRVAVPLLAGASIAVPPRVVRRLLDRIIRRAAASGLDEMAGLRPAIEAEDAVRLFAASLDQDADCVQQRASTLAVDAPVMQAVVALLAVPFLQACYRQWSHRVAESWDRGYCPLCGSWPAFAEVRGIERRRYFRCRCGSEWYARALVCAFCGLSDHHKLTSLVPAKSEVHAVIDACNGCGGYVKTFTRLQGCAPGAVMVEDLASADLDMAAIEHGYVRPLGTGYRLDIVFTEASARRRLFAWNG